MLSNFSALLLSNVLLIKLLKTVSIAETMAVGGVIVCVGDYMDVTNSAFGPTLNGVKAKIIEPLCHTQLAASPDTKH